MASNGEPAKQPVGKLAALGKLRDGSGFLPPCCTASATRSGHITAAQSRPATCARLPVFCRRNRPHPGALPLDAAGADRLRMPTALLRTNRRSVPWRVGACPESSDRRQAGRIFGEGQDDAGDLRKALKAAATALNRRRRFLFRGEDGSVSFYLQMPRGRSRKGTAKNGQRQRRTSMNGRRRRKRTGISTNG